MKKSDFCEGIPQTAVKIGLHNTFYAGIHPAINLTVSPKGTFINCNKIL